MFSRIPYFFILGLFLHSPLLPAQGPRIGIAFSGGGARGAAHIGVLKVLEREGVPIDFIAGSSFGALVGGFYSLGYSAAEIEKIFSSQDWDKLFTDSPDRRLAPLIQRKNFRYQGQLNFRGLSLELPTALWNGQKLIELFNFYTTEGIVAADYDFDRLKIPFRAVATDLLTGKSHIFSRGRMTEAMRASIAIPLVFTPVEKDSMLLVDGGLSNNLPTDIVRSMGADFVIAVDTTTPLYRKEQIRSFLDVMDQSLSLLMQQNVDANLKLADLVVQPELDKYTYNSYAQISEIIALGEVAAAKAGAKMQRLARSRARDASPALASAPAPIVESITFEGLQTIRARQLINDIHTEVRKPLNLDVVRADLGRLHATGLFELVDYSLAQIQGRSYNLNYIFRESPRHTLGASLRFDREYKFVALAEFNSRQMFHSPSSATLSTQFGGLEQHVAALRLIHPSHTALFMEPQVYFRKRERSDTRDRELVDRYTDKRQGAQLMFGGTFFKRLELSGGLRWERIRIVGGSAPNREDDTRFLTGFRLRVNRDTLDDQEFPMSGNLINLQADKLTPELGGDHSYSTWQADWLRAFHWKEKSIINLHLAAAFSRGELPFYDRFFIGGYSFSEGGPRRAVGFSRDELAARQAVLAGATFHQQIFSRPVSFARRGFLTVRGNVASISEKERRPYAFDRIAGIGLGISLDTVIGPMRFMGALGEGGRRKFYISLGPGF